MLAIGRFSGKFCERYVKEAEVKVHFEVDGPVSLTNTIYAQ